MLCNLFTDKMCIYDTWLKLIIREVCNSLECYINQLKQNENFHRLQRQNI